MITIKDLYYEVQKVTKELVDRKVIDDMNIIINNTNLPILIGKSIYAGKNIGTCDVKFINGTITLVGKNTKTDGIKAIGHIYNLSAVYDSDSFLTTDTVYNIDTYNNIDILEIRSLRVLYKKISDAYNKISAELNCRVVDDCNDRVVLKILGRFIAMSIFNNSGLQIIQLHVCSYMHNRMNEFLFYNTHTDDFVKALRRTLHIKNDNKLIDLLLDYLIRFNLLSFNSEEHFNYDEPDYIMKGINPSDKYLDLVEIYSCKASDDFPILPTEKEYNQLLCNGSGNCDILVNYDINTGIISLLIRSESYNYVKLFSKVPSILAGCLTDTNVIKELILDQYIPNMMNRYNRRINCLSLDDHTEKDALINKYVNKTCAILKYISNNVGLDVDIECYAIRYSEVTSDRHMNSKIFQMFYNELL